MRSNRNPNEIKSESKSGPKWTRIQHRGIRQKRRENTPLRRLAASGLSTFSSGRHCDVGVWGCEGEGGGGDGKVGEVVVVVGCARSWMEESCGEGRRSEKALWYGDAGVKYAAPQRPPINLPSRARSASGTPLQPALTQPSERGRRWASRKAVRAAGFAVASLRSGAFFLHPCPLRKSEWLAEAVPPKQQRVCCNNHRRAQNAGASPLGGALLSPFATPSSSQASLQLNTTVSLSIALLSLTTHPPPKHHHTPHRFSTTTTTPKPTSASFHPNYRKNAP